MTPETVMTIARQTLEITAILAGPMLLSSLAVGLLISLFQAATQINEMTLTFIPKLITIGLVILIGGHFLLEQMVNFTRNMIQNIPFVIG